MDETMNTTNVSEETVENTEEEGIYEFCSCHRHKTAYV